MAYDSSFWDTVKGHRLADTLIYMLPELMPKKKMQFSRVYPINDKTYTLASAANFINEECERGSRVVSTTYIEEQHALLVIYEKEIKGGIRQ